jgi:hypothetical protein
LEIKFVNVEMLIPYINNAGDNGTAHVATSTQNYSVKEREQVL